MILNAAVPYYYQAAGAPPADKEKRYEQKTRGYDCLDDPFLSPLQPEVVHYEMGGDDGNTASSHQTISLLSRLNGIVYPPSR